MRRARLLVLMFIAALSAPAVAQQGVDVAPEPGDPPRVIRQTEVDRQVRALAMEIRCVICRGQSIQESNAQLAQEMRGVIREQLVAGKTPDEVRAYFVERYGDQILLVPPARGFNLLVYILPVVVIIAGAVFILVKARRLAAAAPAEEVAQV